MEQFESLARQEVAPRNFFYPQCLKAGGLSLLVHIALLLAAVLLLSTRPRPTRPIEERGVGIVIASRHATPIFFTPSQDASGQLANAEQLEQVLGDAKAAVPPALASLALPTQVPLARELPSGMLAAPTLAAGSRPGVHVEMDDAARAEQAALRQTAEAAGPLTAVSIFGSPSAPGRTFVFVIDRSKSMGSQGLGGLQAAAEELQAALGHLEARHRFQIIAYHHGLVYFGNHRLMPATEENKQAVAPFLSNLAAFGGTEHHQAVLAALALKPDVIFLLTDGGDPELGAGPLSGIRGQAAGKTSIHTVHFGFGSKPLQGRFMETLARENNGSYSYVRRAPR